MFDSSIRLEEFELEKAVFVNCDFIGCVMLGGVLNDVRFSDCLFVANLWDKGRCENVSFSGCVWYERFNMGPSLGSSVLRFNECKFTGVNSNKDAYGKFIAKHVFVFFFFIPIVPLRSYLVEKVGSSLLDMEGFKAVSLAGPDKSAKMVFAKIEFSKKLSTHPLYNQYNFDDPWIVRVQVEMTSADKDLPFLWLIRMPHNALIGRGYKMPRRGAI